MIIDSKCCCAPPCVGAALESCFAVEIWDFYDGLVSGLVRCLNCGATYACKMVDWSRDMFVRIFALQPLEQALSEKIVALQSAWHDRSQAGEREAWWDEMNALVRQASHAKYLFVWKMIIPTGDVIIASRLVSEEEAMLVEEAGLWSEKPWEDWFAAMGVAREENEVDLDAFLALPREEQDRLMAAAAEDAAPLYAADLALPAAERELTAFTALDGEPFYDDQSCDGKISHRSHLR